MVGYVVGPMPGKELLPYNSKPPLFKRNSFAKLADQPTEARMYDPFVRIPFSFLYSLTALNIFLDQGDEKSLPQSGSHQYLQPAPQ